MISIRTMFENTIIKCLKHEFMEIFENKLKNAGLVIDYFGMHMIMKAEYMKSLVLTIQDYLFEVIGMKVNDLNVVGYVHVDDLPWFHSFRVKMNKCGGMDTKGFYNKTDKTVYVRIGEHLKSLLPTLFHELTHAYIDQQNIKIINNFEKPDCVCFDFASRMHEADQEEGVCELVSSLISYHIFNIDQYPSNVDKYWLGWRLSIQGFITFSGILINKYPEKDGLWITKIAFTSIINHLKNTNNLYKFVPLVPKDEYHRTKSITNI